MSNVQSSTPSTSIATLARKSTVENPFAIDPRNSGHPDTQPAIDQLTRVELKAAAKVATERQRAYSVTIALEMMSSPDASPRDRAVAQTYIRMYAPGLVAGK